MLHTGQATSKEDGTVTVEVVIVVVTSIVWASVKLGLEAAADLPQDVCGQDFTNVGNELLYCRVGQGVCGIDFVFCEEEGDSASKSLCSFKEQECRETERGTSMLDSWIGIQQ